MEKCNNSFKTLVLRLHGQSKECLHDAIKAVLLCKPCSLIHFIASLCTVCTCMSMSYGYVCMATYSWLHIYGYIFMATYVWLCMYGYVCMAMHVLLCMYGYVCMAIYLWWNQINVAVDLFESVVT